MQYLFRYLFLAIILLIVFPGRSFAQSEQYAFRVSFKDKNETNYSLSTPLAYLSQRAINRRAKYNIAIDSTDLPIVASYIDSVLNMTNGVLHLTSRWQNHCVVLTADSASVLALQAIGFVNSVKRVAYYSNGLHQKPLVETDSSSSTGNKPTAFDENFYASAWTQINLCNGAYLHEMGKMGEGMLISVIDVGFSGTNTVTAFDSMFHDGRLLDTWNFIYDTSFVFDYGAHGTQVLSCMAAYLPETYVGTAPKAMYALYATDHLSTEQPIEEDNFIAAAERADSLGTDIINSSLGYNTFDNPDDNYLFSDFDGHTTLVAKAANIATRKGILVVTSAGNEGSGTWQKILTPGDADSALTVGSVTSTKAPSSFSGEGPNAAGMLKPNVAAMGSQVAVISLNGNVINTNGASLSTPILSGLAACLMQEAPDLHPLEIRALIESVSHLHDNPTDKSGHGVPNFRLAYDKVTDVNNVAPNKERQFVLYPNPAGRELFLLPKLGRTQKVHCAIFDIQGKLISRDDLSFGPSALPKKIALGGLIPGVYILKINDGQSSQVSKFVKD